MRELCNTVVLLKVDKRTLSPLPRPRKRPERSAGTFYILLVRKKFDVMHYHVLHALLTQALDIFPGSFLYFVPNLVDFPQFSRHFSESVIASATPLANLSIRYYLTARFIHLTNWQFGNLAVVKFMTRLTRSYRNFYRSIFNVISVLRVLQ